MVTEVLHFLGSSTFSNYFLNLLPLISFLDLAHVGEFEPIGKAKKLEMIFPFLPVCRRITAGWMKKYLVHELNFNLLIKNKLREEVTFDIGSYT